MDGVVFFRLSYFDYSDLQLFAIFGFEVDFSETYQMTSAKNSVSEPPNLKLFWGFVPSALAIMRPRYKNSSFGPGPVYASAENPPYRGLLGYIDRDVSLRTRKEEKKVGNCTCYSPFSPH